jgi:hypothetical protein
MLFCLLRTVCAFFEKMISAYAAHRQCLRVFRLGVSVLAACLTKRICYLMNGSGESKCCERIAKIKSVEGFFEKPMQSSDSDGLGGGGAEARAQEHAIFQDKTLGYVLSILSSQQSLVARNRALFLSINLALLVIAMQKIYNLFVYDTPPPSGSTGYVAVYMFFLGVAGVIFSYLWGVTTYYRRHKAWLLESMLLHLEAGEKLKAEFGGPHSIINAIKDADVVSLLRPGSWASKIVIDCEARNIFKAVRLFFVVLWVVVVTVSFWMCMSADPHPFWVVILPYVYASATIFSLEMWRSALRGI